MLSSPMGIATRRTRPDDCRKTMCGLMHAGLLWSKNFGGELITRGFERSQADSCVFRRKHLGKVVVIIVVYVVDLLVLSETKQDEH